MIASSPSYAFAVTICPLITKNCSKSKTTSTSSSIIKMLAMLNSPLGLSEHMFLFNFEVSCT
ncbi:MAG: hypothetical protein ACFFA3_15075 [Promethearchaeota archaeon]